MVIYIYLQQHYSVWSLVTIVVCQIIREKTHKRFATFQYAIIVNFLSLKNSWFGLPRDSLPFYFRMEFYLSLYLRNTLPSTKESRVLCCQLHLDIVSGLLPQTTGTYNILFGHSNQYAMIPVENHRKMKKSGITIYVVLKIQNFEDSYFI